MGQGRLEKARTKIKELEYERRKDQGEEERRMHILEFGTPESSSHQKKESLAQRSLYMFSLISSYPARNFRKGEKSLQDSMNTKSLRRTLFISFLNIRVMFLSLILHTIKHIPAHPHEYSYTLMHTHICTVPLALIHIYPHKWICPLTHTHISPPFQPIP